MCLTIDAVDALDRGLITEGRFAGFLSVDRLESRRIPEVVREHLNLFASHLTKLRFLEQP
ncbi:MAG: hypothetical protein F6J93_14100 [Oscillatoria sp. SIO1A7]|nr:hypothetical protein [Oscillatoria sp. SIO1A7]